MHFQSNSHNQVLSKLENGEGWIESGWCHAKLTSFTFYTKNDYYSIQSLICLFVDSGIGQSLVNDN